jgi:hypothetical protein
MIKQIIKLSNTRYAIRDTNKKGAALLVVLFVIMAITVLSLGFLSRSDVELACGGNMTLRTQMDYLAESGLEHTKGLILNPQDVSSEYWTGATGQQLVAGSDNYYDVSIVRDDPNYCNYVIDCNAYRLQGGETIGQSNLTAELRLNPCIAYWRGSVGSLSAAEIINGDVYWNGNLVSLQGTVNGDVFASGTINAGGTVTGQRYASVSPPPVNSPGLLTSDFSSTYYYDGSGPYTVVALDASYDSNFPGPGASNPACVYYRNGNLELSGTINIPGTLVISGNLTLKLNADCNVTITALKNFPALLVGGNIIINKQGQSITIYGLAQIGNTINMGNNAGSSFIVMGALYSLNGFLNTTGATINITALHDKASIETWPTVDTAVRWTPAGGAFFRSIQRE